MACELQACKNLHHEAMFTSCDQLVHFQVFLPSSGKVFYVPTKFVSSGYSLGGQIVTMGGQPVLDSINSLTDKA